MAIASRSVAAQRDCSGEENGAADQSKFYFESRSGKRDKRPSMEAAIAQCKSQFDCLEYDFKYIRIDGIGRNAFLLTVIDVMSRLNMDSFCKC